MLIASQESWRIETVVTSANVWKGQEKQGIVQKRAVVPIRWRPGYDCGEMAMCLCMWWCNKWRSESRSGHLQVQHFRTELFLHLFTAIFQLHAFEGNSRLGSSSCVPWEYGSKIYINPNISNSYIHTTLWSPYILTTWKHIASHKCSICPSLYTQSFYLHTDVPGWSTRRPTRLYAAVEDPEAWTTPHASPLQCRTSRSEPRINLNLLQYPTESLDISIVSNNFQRRHDWGQH